MIHKLFEEFLTFFVESKWMLLVSSSVLATSAIHAWLNPAWYQDIGTNKEPSVWSFAALVMIASLVPQGISLWWVWRKSEIRPRVPLTVVRLLGYAGVLTLYAVLVGSGVRSVIESMNPTMDYLVIAVRSLPTILAVVVMIFFAPLLAAMCILDAPFFVLRKK